MARYRAVPGGHPTFIVRHSVVSAVEVPHTSIDHQHEATEKDSDRHSQRDPTKHSQHGSIEQAQEAGSKESTNQDSHGLKHVVPFADVHPGDRVGKLVIRLFRRQWFLRLIWFVAHQVSLCQVHVGYFIQFPPKEDVPSPYL